MTLTSAMPADMFVSAATTLLHGVGLGHSFSHSLSSIVILLHCRHRLPSLQPHSPLPSCSSWLAGHVVWHTTRCPPLTVST